uniref:Uncharacterized protein n=1 Tax=Anguilla anguilla TaxID=7936 RepID=A0A0E9TGJ0_ANGAN
MSAFGKTKLEKSDEAGILRYEFNDCH